MSVVAGEENKGNQDISSQLLKVEMLQIHILHECRVADD